jgi:hypothetical protein
MILHNLVLVCLVALAIAALIWVYRRDQRKLRRQRGLLFKDCAALLTESTQQQDGVGYPVLRGRYRGHQFHIDAVVDHIAVRKVPSLWLRVTLLAPLPGLATLDILMRAQNTEFYSPSNDLPHQIDVPIGWPKEAVIRTDDPAHLPPAELVTPHLDFFQRPQAKEMLITAKGLRLVFQASQADKLHYQVLRQANFELPVLATDLLRDLMDRLVALQQSLAQGAPGPAATRDVDSNSIS